MDQWNSYSKNPLVFARESSCPALIDRPLLGLTSLVHQAAFSLSTALQRSGFCKLCGKSDLSPCLQMCVHHTHLQTVVIKMCSHTSCCEKAAAHTETLV